MLDQDPLLGDEEDRRADSHNLLPNKRSLIRLFQTSPNAAIGLLFVGALVCTALFGFAMMVLPSALGRTQDTALSSKTLNAKKWVTLQMENGIKISHDAVGEIVDGTWVTVGWEGIPEEWLVDGSGDYICTQDSFCNTIMNLNMWIGVFGENDDVTTIGPQEWPTGNPPWLATSPIKWKPFNSTAGQMTFLLESNRENLRFHMFSNGSSYPILQGSSAPIKFSDLLRPYAVHIARSWREQDMRVSWQGMTLDRSAKVRWGVSSSQYTHNTSASPSTYTRADLCGPPATTHGWKNQGYFYSALLEDLPAGSEIYYVVGSDESGWTEETSFRAPLLASAEQTLHITALADLGETYIDGAQYHWMEPYAINTTNDVIIAWDQPGDAPGIKRLALNPHKYPGTLSGRMAPPRGKPLHNLRTKIKTQNLDHTDVVLHIGDIAYATGYGSEWDRFMRQIEPIASRVAYMTGQGNHERDYPQSGDRYGGGDSGGECGLPTETRFIMPTPSRKQDSAWYSFNQGPVHFVMMDTEMAYAPGSSQYAFLEQDLSSVNRSVTPWIIFMGHRPMYSSIDHDISLLELEPLLYHAQVDLCLWGHVHNAQASCPMYNFTCIEPAFPGAYDAPIHAVIGNAGQSLSSFQHTPYWRYQASEFGYSTIEVHGSSLLVMRFYLDTDDSLRYQFNITRSPRV